MKQTFPFYSALVYSVFTVLSITGLSGCKSDPSTHRDSPQKIIFDSDFGPDYDDVGALAFLHAMADSGKVDILATLSSNKYSLAAPGMEVINTWFGKPDIPVGAPKNAAVDLGPWQHWADTLVSRYPHKYHSSEETPDVISLYRKILSAQPDSSVTIVTVGFLTNLRDLLVSPPDSHSPLQGKALVSLKVKKLVSMAGGFPQGKEFNIRMDSTASKYTFENWPTQIIFSGFEIGESIRTGVRFIGSGLTNNPVKDVFSICIPMAAEDKMGRMSWDETAVMIAVYGTDGFFETVPGKIIVKDDGSNSWENDPEGHHRYVVRKMSVDSLSRFIEDRMMHLPVSVNKVK